MFQTALNFSDLKCKVSNMKFKKIAIATLYVVELDTIKAFKIVSR